MKTINRNKIQRMIDGYGTYAMGGSGSNGGDMPAGVATQAWTMENFLSIEFFSKLFKAYGPAETEGDPDVEIVPNDVEGTISNIQAMFGFWTEQYISALGQGSGGGGGGGDLNEPLASINTAGLATHPGSAGQTIIWNGSAWVYGSVLNSGVTSVGLSAPTGFNVTGSPITTSGTLALSFASGYELPLAADTAKGVTAYGWGDHSLAGYALASNVYSKTDADAKFLTISFFRSLFRAYTSASAEVQPNDGDTTTISSIKAMFGFWTEQYISALGQGSGGGGGITLNEPLASLNNASLGSPSSAGQAIVWNGSTWKYSSTAGISTTSLNVGGSASISGALSVAGNISSSAGGFIVSGKDDTYVLLAGGGTKLLSEIGGGGAVNSITIGSGGTNYTPDANGIVTIPSYPSTAHLVSGITVNGGTYTPSSGIVVLPAYPTVPTTISSFTNDSGYITGITSSMVTTALGYTPANAASLTGYLPLTGGTLKNGSSQVLLSLDTDSTTQICMLLQMSAVNKSQFGYNPNDGTYIFDYTGSTYLGIKNAKPYTRILSNTYDIFHSGSSRYANNYSANDFISFKAPSGPYLRFSSSDGLILSDSALTYSVVIYTDTDKNLYFYNTSSGNIVFQKSAAGTSFSGKIGIGTDSPSYKLHVDGTIGLTNQLTSTLADGTAPFAVTSSTVCTNLNADLLDGQHGSYYATAASLGDYLPLTGGILTGNLYINNGTHAYTIMRINRTDKAQFGYHYSDGLTIHNYQSGYGLYLRNDGSIQYAGGTVWYSGNDGTGSGLDADLLDGQHASYFAAASELANYLPLTGGTLTGALAVRISTQSYILLQTAGGSNKAQFGYHDSYGLWLYNYQCGKGLTINNNGNVIIGNIEGTPTYKLYVQGAIFSTVGFYSEGYVTALSDIRKKDVREYMDIDYGIVADAPMIKFTWKDGRCDGKLQVGSIAQYWQKKLPEAVSEMADGELSMSYGVIALLSSIATARKVRDHEQRIQELERENKMLHKHIAELQKFNNVLNG